MMFWSVADAQTKKTITFYMKKMMLGEKTSTFYNVLKFSRCSDQDNHYFFIWKKWLWVRKSLLFIMFWSLADAQTKKTITFYMENVIVGEKTITFYYVLEFSQCSD